MIDPVKRKGKNGTLFDLWKVRVDERAGRNYGWKLSPIDLLNDAISTRLLPISVEKEGKHFSGYAFVPVTHNDQIYARSIIYIYIYFIAFIQRETESFSHIFFFQNKKQLF